MMQPASLETFDVDAGEGVLGLTFTRAIVLGTLDLDKVLLTSEIPGTAPVPLSALDGARVVPINTLYSTQISLVLGPSLVSHLRSATAILSSRNTTRLFLEPAAAMDVLHFSLTPIAAADAVAPTTFTPDTHAPTLLDVQLSTTSAGYLLVSLSTSEPVLPSRVDGLSSSSPALAFFNMSSSSSSSVIATVTNARLGLQSPPPAAPTPTTRVVFSTARRAPARALAAYLRTAQQQQGSESLAAVAMLGAQLPAWRLHDWQSNGVQPDITSSPVFVSSVDGVDLTAPTIDPSSIQLNLAQHTLSLLCVDTASGFASPLPPPSSDDGDVVLRVDRVGDAPITLTLAVANAQFARLNDTHVHVSWSLSRMAQLALQSAVTADTAAVVRASVPAGLLADRLDNPSTPVNSTVLTRVVADTTAPTLSSVALDLGTGGVTLETSELVAFNTTAAAALGLPLSDSGGLSELPLHITFSPGSTGIVVVLHNLNISTAAASQQQQLRRRRRRRQASGGVGEWTFGNTIMGELSSRDRQLLVSRLRTPAIDSVGSVAPAHDGVVVDVNGNTLRSSSSSGGDGASPPVITLTADTQAPVITRTRVAFRHSQFSVVRTSTSGGDGGDGGDGDGGDGDGELVVRAASPSPVRDVRHAVAVVVEFDELVTANASAFQEMSVVFTTTAGASVERVLSVSETTVLTTPPRIRLVVPGLADALTAFYPTHPNVALRLPSNDNNNTNSSSSENNGTGDAVRDVFGNAFAFPVLLPLALSDISPAVSRSLVRIEPATLTTTLTVITAAPLVNTPVMASAVYLSIGSAQAAANTGTTTTAAASSSSPPLSSMVLVPMVNVTSPAVGSASTTFEFRVANDLVQTLTQEQAILSALSSLSLHIVSDITALDEDNNATLTVAAGTTYATALTAPASEARVVGFSLAISVFEELPVNVTVHFSQPVVASSVDPAGFALRSRPHTANDDTDTGAGDAANGDDDTGDDDASSASGSGATDGGGASAESEDSSNKREVVFGLGRATAIVVDAWTVTLALSAEDAHVLQAARKLGTRQSNTFLSMDEGALLTVYGSSVGVITPSNAIMAEGVSDASIISSHSSAWTATEIAVVTIICAAPFVLYALFTLVYMYHKESHAITTSSSLWDSQMRPKRSNALHLSWDDSADVETRKQKSPPPPLPPFPLSGLSPKPKKKPAPLDRGDTGISVGELQYAREHVLQHSPGHDSVYSKHSAERLAPVREEAGGDGDGSGRGRGDYGSHDGRGGVERRETSTSLLSAGPGPLWTFVPSSDTASTAAERSEDVEMSEMGDADNVEDEEDVAEVVGVRRRTEHGPSSSSPRRNLGPLFEESATAGDGGDGDGGAVIVGASEDDHRDSIEFGAGFGTNIDDPHRRTTLAGFDDVSEFVGETVIAIWGYQAQYQDELSFEMDEALVLVGGSELEDEFVQVLSPKTHAMGLAPKSYLCFPHVYKHAKRTLSHRPTLSRTNSQDSTPVQPSSTSKLASPQSDPSPRAPWGASSRSQAAAIRVAAPPVEEVDPVPRLNISRDASIRRTRMRASLPAGALGRRHQQHTRHQEQQQQQQQLQGGGYATGSAPFSRPHSRSFQGFRPPPMPPAKTQHTHDSSARNGGGGDGDGQRRVSSQFEALDVASALNTMNGQRRKSSADSTSRFTGSWEDLSTRMKHAPSNFGDMAETSDL
ncbi:hypothetical protein PTSG_08874 [Salpingoeca rosetta]|uniref:SH3 domain-containing protein n=1 Tax=Salpingoeca rosetta (strain ATCC 50818 / BSB-021) TaxID=946362 RepID=F2UKY5_SALR5|nr:uncharacterized protein PTSG_08874 [Salpingoeca rosetta]EGD77784.1 hypothetical protein PTSG_08874 [Salpingoeca rosetta]|eukprot:XP_004990260.1 hypothetical protein PTSG_08874 [Salpingoeca rosetta]